jgi:hypothetical protein
MAGEPKYMWDASVPKFTTPAGREAYLAGYYKDGAAYKNCSFNVWGTLPSDTVYAEQAGLSEENTPTQNYLILQNLVDNTLYRIVVVGHEPSQVFEISQPIIVPSNKVFLNHATIKIIDATTVALTEDVDIGDTVINVTDSSGFEVGQWVTVTDDILPVQGGASTQTRHVGFCSRIVDVDTGTITLKNASTYDVSAGDNGRVGQTQSVIIINEVENVYVGGMGWIDGNKSGQLDCEPVTVIGSVDPEDAGLGGMGICCHHSTNIWIDKFYAKNALVTNVSLGTGTNINYVNSWAKLGHDKNIVCYDLEESFIDMIYADESDHEDGIAFYAQNQNTIIGTIICRDNPRVGLAMSGSSYGCVVGNAVLIGNGNNIQISAKGIQLGQIRCEGGGDRNASAYIYNGYDVRDVIIDSLVIETPDSSGDAGLLIRGAVDGVVINSLVVNGLTGKPAMKADDFESDTNYPSHIYIATLLRYDCDASDIDVNCTDVTVGKEMVRGA